MVQPGTPMGDRTEQADIEMGSRKISAKTKPVPPSPGVRTHHQDWIHCLGPLVSKPTSERPRPMQFRHTILCLAVILSCLTYGADTAHGQPQRLPGLSSASERTYSA